MNKNIILQNARINLTIEDYALLAGIKNKNRLSMGNHKIDGKVGIFNLLAKEDCGNCSSCQDSCYALFRQGAKNVHMSRSINSSLARTNLRVLKTLLIEQIVGQNITIVRIHESGDFIDNAYVKMWLSIAKLLANVQFYSYTKMTNLLKLEELNNLPNVNVINSFINGERNYGSLDYCLELKKKYKAFICPAIGCMDTCTYCLKGSTPCFVIHGNRKGKDTYENHRTLGTSNKG